jgi:hypothetical protein
LKACSPWARATEAEPEFPNPPQPSPAAALSLSGAFARRHPPALRSLRPPPSFLVLSPSSSRRISSSTRPGFPSAPSPSPSQQTDLAGPPLPPPDLLIGLLRLFYFDGKALTCLEFFLIFLALTCFLSYQIHLQKGRRCSAEHPCPTLIPPWLCGTCSTHFVLMAVAFRFCVFVFHDGHRLM